MAATPWASDRNWELVFEDDFDGSSLNEHNWSRIDYVGYNAPDWRKYQSRDESLVEFREKDGNSAMTLWGKYGDYTTQTNQTAPAKTYACGGVYSLKTFSFQYGYVEVRARFDCVQGVWPAIWMMPKSDSIGWPVGGEIDIMEHLKYEGRVYQTIPWSQNGVPNQDKSQGVTPGWNDGAEKANWHTYGMEWTEEGITFYVDGKATGSFKKPNNANWPFDKDGNEVSPAPGGDPWSYFDYWTGWDDTQIYDSHGEGFYVTAKVNASRIKVGFGNGGENAHTNIEIYVDGELKLTCNGTEEFDGVPWYTEVIEVTPGEHTVMVKAGTPKTPETWNGLTFNVVSYVPAS